MELSERITEAQKLLKRVKIDTGDLVCLTIYKDTINLHVVPYVMRRVCSVFGGKPQVRPDAPYQLELVHGLGHDSITIVCVCPDAEHAIKISDSAEDAI